MTDTRATPRARQAARLLRRVGAVGFAFFCVKGLLWLAVPALLWMIRG
ncbi:MAG: alanyl-tRNA synthetase [Acidobacteriota bacterium]|nr:MAG: alanyl-tRNA synthetase [Acidobacteriota bacterium]